MILPQEFEIKERNAVMLKKYISIILCIMLTASFYGCGKKNTDTAADITTGTNVSVYEVEKGDIESSVSYSGTICAAESVSISSKVSAKAVNVLAKDGDYVEAGDVLCELDTTDISLSYEQALAGYNSAVAGYNSVVNSSSKMNSAQAKQALSNAQITFEQAQANYNRESELFASNSQVTIAQQQYETAKAAYEREKALYEANVSSASAQAGVTSAGNNVINAQNAFDNAQKNYDRTKQLYDLGGATQIELDNAKTSLDSAQLALESAKASSQSANASLTTVELTSSAAMDAAYAQMITAEKNLIITKNSASAGADNAKYAYENAKNALGVAKENINLTANANKAAIDTAKASVDSAKAALNIAKNNLNNTSITAPVSGYVSKCTAVTGQNVAAGMEIFVIKNTDIVDIQINVTESVIPMISNGSKAIVSVSSAKLSDLEGAVTSVNPVKDDMTGMYGVKVTLDNSDGKLNVGMLADIKLTTASIEDTIKVPSEALINEDDEYYVYIAENGKAKKINVITGISDETYTEIYTGLSVGDSVVVSGKEYISETNNEINITEKYKKE